jgi:hypothetical protein
VSPEKSSTPNPSPNKRFLLPLVFLLSSFVPAGPRTELAQAWTDPAARIPAQDEALYAHGTLRIAQGEDILTPHFLGRLSLVKPPLLLWLSAASTKIFGPHPWALRLPSILAAAATLTLVFHLGGPVAWLLLATRLDWTHRAGLLLMDDLLTLLYCLCAWLLIRDPKLTQRYSGYLFGLLIGLAVMTKWFAGLLPLALLLYARPKPRRLLEISFALTATAAPWHLYQFFANRDWFLAEYLGVELFTYAFRAPLQSTAEPAWSFYGSRLLYSLPLLAPPLWAFARRKTLEPSFALLTLVITAALFAYSYRNATYLTPLLPALLLCHRGWIPWYFAPLALILAPIPPLPALDPVDNRYQGRELLCLDPDENLRSSLAPDATVRYILFLDHLPPNGPLDFEKRGIAVSVPQFLNNPSPQVDAILAPNLDALRQLILASPQRDFLIPQNTWRTLNLNPPHQVLSGVKIHLQSRNPQPGPRPNRFPALSEAQVP